MEGDTQPVSGPGSVLRRSLENHPKFPSSSAAVITLRWDEASRKWTVELPPEPLGDTTVLCRLEGGELRGSDCVLGLVSAGWSV